MIIMVNIFSFNREASSSYEMLEYNLITTSQRLETKKLSLGKNCLCWHSDVREKYGRDGLDSFQREFEERLDQGLIGHEVCRRDGTCLFLESRKFFRKFPFLTR